MTDEQRTKIFDTFMKKIMANKKLTVEKYVEVEDYLLSLRQQNPEAIDIAIECIEYVNRMCNYGWGMDAAEAGR